MDALDNLTRTMESLTAAASLMGESATARIGLMAALPIVALGIVILRAWWRCGR